MRDSVLQRKLARIVMLLATSADISPEQALDIFYKSETYKQLTNSATGLHLMSDDYILEDLLHELNN
ncbi:MAG: DUF3791 domain-containing protein [Paludibacteraceae bacterium]|nr:DUF3791 domain-containing protein [Paludibacteraceae bacterium]